MAFFGLGDLQSIFFIKYMLFGTPKNAGPDEVRSDLRGHLRPKSRLRLISLKGGE